MVKERYLLDVLYEVVLGSGQTSSSFELPQLLRGWCKVR